MNFNILSNLRLQIDSNEKWKQVIINVEIMNYFISNHGNIRSHVHHNSWYLNVIDKTIYTYMYCGAKLHTFPVHELVAKMFISDSKETVRHKDGNKLNNYVNNLEYVPKVCNNQNLIDALGIKAWAVPIIQYSNEGLLINSFDSAVDASNKTGLFVGDIMNICKHNGNFKYIQKPLFSVEEPPEGLIHVNYPRYIITCDGKIYSIVLKEYLVPKLCKAGYQYTLMSNKGRQQDVLIHSIVATLYVYNPNLSKYTYVNHIDGLCDNNSYKNLKWSECNWIDAAHKATQAVIQYDQSDKEVGKFISTSSAAKSSGIPASVIYAVCKGYLEHSHGYVWKYIDYELNHVNVKCTRARPVIQYN